MPPRRKGTQRAATQPAKSRALPAPAANPLPVPGKRKAVSEADLHSFHLLFMTGQLDDDGRKEGGDSPGDDHTDSISEATNSEQQDEAEDSGDEPDDESDEPEDGLQEDDNGQDNSNVVMEAEQHYELSTEMFDPWFGITAEELSALSFPIPSSLTNRRQSEDEMEFDHSDDELPKKRAREASIGKSKARSKPKSKEDAPAASAAEDRSKSTSDRGQGTVPKSKRKRTQSITNVEPGPEREPEPEPEPERQVDVLPRQTKQRKTKAAACPANRHETEIDGDETEHIPPLVMEIVAPLVSPIVTRLIAADRRKRKRLSAVQAPATTSPTKRPRNRRETIAVVTDKDRHLSEADVLRFYYEQALSAAPAVILPVPAPHSPTLNSHGIPHALAAPDAPDQQPQTAKKMGKRDGVVPVGSKPVTRATHVTATCEVPIPRRKLRARLSAPAVLVGSSEDSGDPKPSEPVPNRAPAQTTTSSAPISPPAVTGSDSMRAKLKSRKNAQRPRISESDVFLFHQTHSMPATETEASNEADTIPDAIPLDPRDDTDDSHDNNRAESPDRHFSRTSSASVSDMLTSPMSDSDFSFLVSSSPVTSPTRGLRGPSTGRQHTAPKWQVASPVIVGPLGSGTVRR